MSFLPLARGSATLEYFYTITGAKNHKNPFIKSTRSNGGNIIIGDGSTAVVAMDLGNFFRKQSLENTLFHSIFKNCLYWHFT